MFKPTSADFRYWSIKTAPRWADKLKVGDLRAALDAAINSHARRPPSCCETHNLIVLLQMKARRGESAIDALRAMATRPTASRKRQAICLRWLRKLSAAVPLNLSEAA